MSRNVHLVYKVGNMVMLRSGPSSSQILKVLRIAPKIRVHYFNKYKNLVKYKIVL